MIEKLELSESKVLPSMPDSYVKLVRQLWRKDTNQSMYTWSGLLLADRRPVYLKLLASEVLSRELQRAYDDRSIGPKIAKALTSVAVRIPERWMSVDKRTKKDQAAQFQMLRTAKSAINKALVRLDQDRTVQDRRPAQRSSNKVDALAHRLVPLAFDDIISEPVVLNRWNSRPLRVRLSIYDLNAVLRGFDKPINQEMENIKKYRTNTVADPVLRYLGQITKGASEVRYAALSLDFSIDRFARDLEKLHMSRDKLISAFVRALFPEKGESVVSYQAINRICSRRRKLITKRAA